MTTRESNKRRVFCLWLFTHKERDASLRLQRVEGKKLNRCSLIMAICLNGFLIWIYWTYAPVVLAQEEEEPKVTFFEDNTGTITNGTIWIKFNYTFTEPDPAEIEYTTEGLKFKNNGTVILN
jgi:hypothetical protein